MEEKRKWVHFYDDAEEEGIEESLTDKQAKRLTECVVKNEHSKEKAYEALAYVLGATVD